jgi:hypothetical protein
MAQGRDALELLAIMAASPGIEWVATILRAAFRRQTFDVRTDSMARARLPSTSTRLPDVQNAKPHCC